MVVGIDELFEIAEQNSTSIKTYKTGTEAAEEELKAAKAQRLPDINASVSVSYLGNGRIWDRDFTNGMKVDIPHFGNNFYVEARQVIYAGGAVNSGVELAEIGKAMAELDYRKNVQEIRFLITGHCLDIYKIDNQIQVIEKHLALTDSVLVMMRAKREQGTVLKNDITRYELQRETLALNLAKLKDSRTILNHYLVTALHLPEGTEIVPDSRLLTREVRTMSEEDWQEEARQGNIGLQQSELGIKINEQNLKLERAEKLPQIALVAADNLDGPVTIEVPALNNNFNYWYVGVGISYNFSSLFKNNHKVKQARIQVQQAHEQHELMQEQVKNAVNAGYVNFLTAYTDLHTQEKKVELADVNYDIVLNRYENGLAILTDLLDASSTKIEADLGLVNANIDVIYSYYKMKYLTHSL